MKHQPNILLVMTDQQHFGMMSCAGNTHVRTPAMDGLAAEGVRFDRAYCTNPLCSPSRFSLMTGRMPSAIGMFSNRVDHIDPIPDSIKRNAIGHLMKDAGYDAAYAGKEHLPHLSASDIGFDYLCEDERDDLTETCVEFLKQERSRPFFLVASFINPHDICFMAIRDAATADQRPPQVPPPVHLATLEASLARPEGVGEEAFFAEHCPPLPPNFEPQEDEPEAIGALLDQRPFRRKARREWDEKRWREHRWAYARLTEKVDGQIGRVLEALKETGQLDNTVVIFTSDHGDMDAAHRMEHKSTLYDEACRIPLIIRPPGGTSARVDKTHLVSNGLDFVPTFCDWAGIAPPAALAGRSLRPLVENAEPHAWRATVPVECAVGRAIITDQFKYCVYGVGKNWEQVIDLKSDPHETRNALNRNTEHPEVEKFRTLFAEIFGSEHRSPSEILTDAANA